MRRFENLLGTLCVAAMVALSASAACISEDATNANPCPGGVCGPGSGPGSSGNGVGGGGCVEHWLCSPWDTQGQGNTATRTCIEDNNCGTTANKPVEQADLPALDENYYRCNVEPILDKGCALLGCHGVEPDLANGKAGRALRTYHRGRLRITGETWIEPGCLSAGTPKPSESCIGSIECMCWTLPHSPAEWQRNFDSARGFALQANGTPIAAPADSELLTQPLKGGGLAHAGIKIWTQGSPEYQTIHDWLNGATLAACNSTN